MITIYKYDPYSDWYREVVSDNTLKGKARNKAIDDAIQKNGTEISIIEYFQDTKRNTWGKGYCYACFGDVDNCIERIVNAEINYENDLGYLSAKENNPEDLIKSRTSWDEMKDYADGLYYFIQSLISEIVCGKISIPQKQWKPSEEQMKTLQTVGNMFRTYEDKHKILFSLYNDLKQL